MALIFLRVGLRVITRSLKNLAVEANRIAEGKLDHPLQTTGVDEVGQLRRAFEQMRVSLAARLDELNCLVVVSQGVASSLEMQQRSSRYWMRSLVHRCECSAVVLALHPFCLKLPPNFRPVLLSDAPKIRTAYLG